MKSYLNRNLCEADGITSMRVAFRLRRTLVWFISYATIIVCTAILFAACREKKQPETATAKKDVYYTCSMHPQVVQDHPGNCPVCGMKLFEVPKTSANTDNEIHLSAEQIQLGNIIVDTIRNGSIGDKMILTGTLNFNLQKLSSVSARIEGRIEKLYFKNIGDYIHKGDKLYDLYSEQLNSAKQEYINVLQQEKTVGNTLINYNALIESAKSKLLLWGMTNGQINELAQSNTSSTLTSFYSTEDGYVTTLNVKEGDYTTEGGTVVQLANLSTLWAEAQVYTTQMNALDKDGTVTVQIPELNDKAIDGTIDFVNPEINPDTRVNLVRVTIQNPNNELHPGMPVSIVVNSRQHNSITLPMNAVIIDGKGATVWVQAKPGAYEVRMVKTGINDGNSIEIISGLHTGDIVVTSGAYLINSEYIFEHGANPMAGHDMSKM
jgi:Cu(I)/Ag(I) efflux system membrane fusion protein